MKTTIDIRCQPFKIPSRVLYFSGSGDLECGYICTKDIDAVTLAKLCQEFTKGVFEMAGQAEQYNRMKDHEKREVISRAINKSLRENEPNKGYEMKQQKLMFFDPRNGLAAPYPSHAKQYRIHHGGTAWLYNPWTGKTRSPMDIGSDVFGQLIDHE